MKLRPEDYPVRLVMDWDAARTGDNQLRRLHWKARWRLDGDARGTARAAWLRAGSPVSGCPVRLHVISRRARRMDPLNVWGAVKPLVDGVFVGALTPNDSEAWLRPGEVRQEIDPRYRGHEQVEFVIEPVESE